MSKRCALVLGVVAVFLSAALVAKAQDQVGAPKMLTPEIVKNAVGLVKEGKRYSLARTLEIEGASMRFEKAFATDNAALLPRAASNYETLLIGTAGFDAALAAFLNRVQQRRQGGPRAA